MTSQTTPIKAPTLAEILEWRKSPESQKMHEEWVARQELERQRLVAIYSKNPAWQAKAEASGNPEEFWKHFYIGRVA